MTSKKATMEKVREELICAVCLDFLQDPKVLLCAHSFCLGCLRRIVNTQTASRQGGEGIELECPSCRHVTQLPGGKAENLRTNSNLKSLVDIVSDENKKLARDTVRIWRSRRPKLDRSNQPQCSVHSKPLEYYCQECDELLCRKCMMGGHKEHNYQDVEELLPSEINALRNLIQPACEIASRAESTMEKLVHERDLISTNGDATTKAIRLLFAEMRDALKSREDALLTTVQKYTDTKLTKLDSHHQRLEDDRTAIRDIVGQIGMMLQVTQSATLLAERRSITEELDIHQQSVLSIGDAPNDKSMSSSFLTFKPEKTLLQAIDKVGILNECRREPNSVFLTVRRVVVTQDEDPYLDVPLRFEDDTAAPQTSVRIDETHQELQLSCESLNGQLEESCYDTPRLQSPPLQFELPPRPGSHNPKPPPRPSKTAMQTQSETTKSPQVNGTQLTPPPTLPKPPVDVTSRSPRRLPQVSPHSSNQPLDMSPQSPGHTIVSGYNDQYDVPKLPAEVSGIYDTPRKGMADQYDIVPRRSPLPQQKTARSQSATDYHSFDMISSDEEDYDPVLDIMPVPKPRQKPPPLPPNHPGQREKPVPKPRRAVSVSSSRSLNTMTGDKPIGTTLPRESDPSHIGSLPESQEILIPMMVLGKEELSLPYSHETVFPCGVCYAGMDDLLIVTDVFNHCLRVMDTNGRFVERMGCEGRKGGQFKEPSAVTVTPDNHILVAERDNPRVQKFNAHRKYVSKFGQKVLWGSQLNDPLALAVNRNGNVYVSDWDKSIVMVFNSTGKLLFSINPKEDELGFPAGLAFDARGRLLVADRKSHCVRIFTPDGDYIGKIGSEGKEPGQLYFPYGIAITSKGNLIVTESGNDRVSVFSAAGVFLESFGGPGSDPGMFNHPRHVCVNGKGQIVIADEMNQRLQIFELDL